MTGGTGMRTMRRHTMRSACALAVWVALFATARAGAEPYQLIAVYTPVIGTARDIRLVLTKDTLLPDGAEGYRLARIVVHFKEDALAATTLSAFSRFEFRVTVGQQAPDRPLPVEATELEAHPDQEIPLLEWTGDGQRDPRTLLNFEVRSIYTADFLCTQERALRNREGEEVPVHPWNAWHLPEPAGRPEDSWSAGAPPASAASPSHDGGSAPRPRLLRAEGGGPLILFTFCKGPSGEDLNDTRNWDLLVPERKSDPDALAVFRFEDLPADAKAPDVRRRHKRALVERLATRLNQFPSRYGQATVDPTAEDYDKALLYVRDEYPLSILKAGGAVKLEEESSGQVRPLADQLDQKSQVLLSLEHDLCIELPSEGLLKPPWFFELEVEREGEANGAKTLDVQLTFRHGCTRVLAVPWKDLLDQQVTFRIVFRYPGADDLVVYRHAFHVYNFGLITIFPVASEILGAATGASSKDIESSSVIPISWALSVGGDRSNSYAVTFPFILGVNTRSAPRLAEYIALAPSVSVIAGDASQAPHFAFGFGVNLARAFHFGYAWAPDSSSNYVLIGVAIPELLPLLSGLGGSPGARP